MITIKDMIAAGDNEMLLLVDDFTEGNIGWDEFYSRALELLVVTNEQPSLDEDYERAMKGI